jgi:hypothetical protein
MNGSAAAVEALAKFGYTERQAAFLRIVALHSGYFLARQYDFYIGAGPGGPRRRLIDQLVARGHVRELPSCDNTTIYHLYGRRFYAALGIENSRNRRAHQPFVLKTRIMALDFVLSHLQAQFLATECERVELFTDILKLHRTILPAKFYASKGGTNKTIRHFVDRNPLFLCAAAEGTAPVVGFAYINTGTATTAGFRSYLEQYRRLLGALGNFRLVYVANKTEMFAQARQDFTKVLALDISSDRERTVSADLLLEHFEARARHERRDYKGFDTARINRLAKELREFTGPRFNALFGIFQTQGTHAMLLELARLKAARTVPHGIFELQILPYSYAFLGRV